MIIYDCISADHIEDGDQIIVNGELVSDVVRFADVDERVFINGYSHNTGDRENYSLGFDDPVDLWSV